MIKWQRTTTENSKNLADVEKEGSGLVSPDLGACVQFRKNVWKSDNLEETIRKRGLEQICSEENNKIRKRAPPVKVEIGCTRNELLTIEASVIWKSVKE